MNLIRDLLNHFVINDLLDIFDPVGIVQTLGLEVFFFTLKFIFYPLFAIGIYQLSKKRKLMLPILAIFPIINLIYIGFLIKEINVLGKRIKGVHILLPLLYVLSVVPLGAIPFIGIIEGVFEKAYYLLFLISMHRLFEMYAPQKADTYIITGVVFSFMMPVFTYRIRGNELVNSKLVLDYDLDGEWDESIDIFEAEETRVEPECLTETAETAKEAAVGGEKEQKVSFAASLRSITKHREGLD